MDGQRILRVGVWQMLVSLLSANLPWTGCISPAEPVGVGSLDAVLTDAGMTVVAVAEGLTERA